MTSWTDPITYARQLKRMMDSNQLTVEEMAEKIGNKSVEWIRQMVSLDDLIFEIQEMVSGGALNHEIAFLVARMSVDQQMAVKNMICHVTLEEASQIFKNLGIHPDDKPQNHLQL